MGGSPIILQSSSMVSSPLHLATPLTERLLKASPNIPPGVEDQADKSNGNTNFYDDCPVGSKFNLLEIEQQHPMSDESHGSSSDLVLQNLLRKSDKHVAFGDICTRSYNIVLGDHPCCSVGCPLALGWEYSQDPNVSVDDYEASRSPRRAREDLRIPSGQRRNMLTDVSDGEVKRAERKLHRERSCHRKQNRRTCAAFFSQEIPEDCQQTVVAAASQAQCTLATIS